jgi:hypothetical protein
MISPCDFIWLDGCRWHIIWVGPTYFLSSGGGDSVFEPVGDPVTNPVCQDWHQLYPEYCITYHVDGWNDNGDGIINECDVIIMAGQEWHIDQVGLDIIVEPGQTGTEETSWGKVKKLFGGIF